MAGVAGQDGQRHSEQLATELLYGWAPRPIAWDVQSGGGEDPDHRVRT
jgi:hypothetical protein